MPRLQPQEVNFHLPSLLLAARELVVDAFERHDLSVLDLFVGVDQPQRVGLRHAEDRKLDLHRLSVDRHGHAVERELEAHPAIGKLRNTCHGNSFSIYFPDPEGNVVELAVESVWYVPAPHGAPLDLSWSDEKLLDWAENHVRETPGFMMRADWKKRAREQLLANGHIEAEGLVSDVA